MRRLIAITTLVLLAACEENRNYSNVVTFTNHKGGVVLHHAGRVDRAIKNNTLVRLKGFCNSSCTMYLALAPERLCIYSGTVFNFHKSWGAPASELAKLDATMMSYYPQWVLDWLGPDGLQKNYETMPFDVAAQHVRICQ